MAGTPSPNWGDLRFRVSAEFTADNFLCTAPVSRGAPGLRRAGHGIKRGRGCAPNGRLGKTNWLVQPLPGSLVDYSESSLSGLTSGARLRTSPPAPLQASMRPGLSPLQSPRGQLGRPTIPAIVRDCGEVEAELWEIAAASLSDDASQPETVSKGGRGNEGGINAASFAVFLSKYSFHCGHLSAARCPTQSATVLWASSSCSTWPSGVSTAGFH